MPYWSWRQWLAEPGRAALSSLLFAAVAAVGMVFEGLRYGLIEDLRAVPAGLPADLIAVERGKRYFALAPSKLPQRAREQAEAVPGVRTAHPIALVPVIANWNGRRSPAVLLADDRAAAAATLVSGGPLSGPAQILVDAALAQLHGLRVGDGVELLDYRMTIAGLTRGSASPFAPYLRIDYDDLLSMVLESELPLDLDDASLVSMLLIELEPGADRTTLRERLRTAVPDADIFTPAELGANDAAFGRRLLDPVLALLSGIAWLIGVLTMGLLRAVDVRAQWREYGVQKALGAGPMQLAASLLLGGGLIAVASLLPAIAFATALAQLVASWNPLYVPRILESAVLLPGLALTMLAALAGSLVPLRRLLRLDPVLVFQR